MNENTKLLPARLGAEALHLEVLGRHYLSNAS